MVEQVGCIHYTSEPRTWDFPGCEDCDIDMEDAEDPDGWLAQCGPGCAGFEAVLDEATARNI